MKKISALLSMLVLSAMVLAACGGGATSTSVVPTTLPATAESTNTSVATESPTEAVPTGTPGVPVTGGVNPASMSNELNFSVLDQDGNQVGQVEDMVLDLNNTQVAYVVVNTSGFGDLGDRKILVPWSSLKLQTGPAGTGTGLTTETPTAGTGTGLATETPTAGTGTSVATDTPAAGTGTSLVTDTPSAGTSTGLATATAGTGTGSGTGGISEQENAFILQTDMETFKNAPDFDLSTLPQMGQPVDDWDAEIRSYWQNAGSGTANSTPSANGTVAPEMTATAGTGSNLGTTTPSAGTGLATATPTAGTGSGTGTGQGAGPLQGVALASNVIGSTIALGTQGPAFSTATPGTGAGTSLSTATPSAGTSLSTSTPGAGTSLSTATPGTGTGTTLSTETPGTGTGTSTIPGNLSATISDLIVDINDGNILYIVVDTSFDNSQHLIPVPPSLFQFGNGGFGLNIDMTMLQNAPVFQDGAIPDTTMPDWDSEFSSFWQGSGAGTGAATATVTP
ncbi:MAG TPA: PRC-barrel domain-containing protein [Anaerolineales bacterium]|nr:PRC-barrel domain-containing protein [Anaerolineales bacterium]